jgi:methionyl-tRNA formyltransferase
MKIVLWIGRESNQKALANKIHAIFPVTAIVTESRKSKTKITLPLLAEKVFEKLLLAPMRKAWQGMLRNYDKQFPSFPAVDTIDVENINSQAAYDFTQKHQPDLILVSGTRLVKEKMLAINPAIGILNLHTGLSPYVKGGPNCTNWCVAKKDFHLIGNTIMWIDKGIDTGNILTTEFTPIEGDEDLSALHVKVMEHAHALYIRSLQYLASGKTQSVKQSDIAPGTTFYTREWTWTQKLRLIRNISLLKKFCQNGELSKRRKAVRTINLNFD